MITFTICLLALIAGYFIYGRLVERVFGPDDRKTPALTHADSLTFTKSHAFFTLTTLSIDVSETYSVGNP